MAMSRIATLKVIDTIVKDLCPVTAIVCIKKNYLKSDSIIWSFFQVNLSIFENLLSDNEKLSFRIIFFKFGFTNIEVNSRITGEPSSIRISHTIIIKARLLFIVTEQKRSL